MVVMIGSQKASINVKGVDITTTISTPKIDEECAWKWVIFVDQDTFVALS